MRVGALELDIVARKVELVVIVEGEDARRGVVRERAREHRREETGLSGSGRRATLAKRAVEAPGVERVRIDVAAVTFDERGTHVEYVEAAITA